MGERRKKSNETKGGGRGKRNSKERMERKLQVLELECVRHLGNI